MEQKIAGAFGAVLKGMRLDRKMTQEQLGLEAGIQRKYVSLLERGEKAPSLATVLRVSRALNVEPGTLVALVAAQVDDAAQTLTTATKHFVPD